MKLNKKTVFEIERVFNTVVLFLHFPLFRIRIIFCFTYIPKCKTLSNYSYVILLYDHEIKTVLDLNPIFH
jgi:hypothetical protein